MLNWLPENISSFGHEIDGVMYLIYYIVGAWFILAEGVLFYFIFKYRRQSGRKAVYETGSTFKALAWVLLPVFVILMCDFAIDAKGASAWDHVKLQIPPHDVLVRIEAQQFAFTFRNAGASGKLDTADNIVTAGELHVPVNKVVRFELESRDVIHSFWVPNLRLKQDAVPGRTIPGWFKATKVGSYPITCAQICGVGHGVMNGTLIVQEQQDYDAWLKK